MDETTPLSPVAATVEMQDFTLRFSPIERKSIATALNERGMSEVLYIVTNDGNADVFLFTVQRNGPKVIIGKGRGEIFLALHCSAEGLASSRELADIFEALPEFSAAEVDDK